MIRRVSTLAAAIGLVAAAGEAQGQQAAAAAVPFGAYVASAEWLHGNSGALHRDALPSYGWSLGVDRPAGLRLEAGYLRVARPTTTAKGFMAGAGWNFVRGPVTVRPGVSTLIGVAETNAASDGYDWRGLDETPYEGSEGHQGRQRYERGTTVGAGLNLAADLHLVAGLSLTGSVRQWLFSGDVLSGNRDRTLAGLGLSVRPGVVAQAIRGTPTRQISSKDKENGK